MKRMLFIAFMLTVCLGYGQKRIKIGDTEYQLSSPVKSMKTGEETVSVDTNSSKRAPSRYINNLFVGIGFTVAKSGDQIDLIYGKTYGLEIGYREMYRATKFVGFGAELKYSFYNYRLNNTVGDIFELGIPKGISPKMYYRTDNLGVGLLTTFFFTNKVQLSLGAWGDFAYSKRLKLKDFSTGSKEKYKYRDGSKLMPFQAGVQAGLNVGVFNVYAKYRLTESFRNMKVPDLPKLSIGTQFIFGRVY